jgi:hypothetical protein
VGDTQLRARSLRLSEELGFTLDGVRLMSTAIRETRRERDGAEWDGDLTKADRLSVELTELLRGYEAGEQYDPLF